MWLKRSLFVVAILFVSAFPAAAQVEITVVGQAPQVDVRASLVSGRTAPMDPSAVLNRILSFDLNGDDCISMSELPERMQDLVARGDENRDGLLSDNEVRQMVARPSPALPSNVRLRAKTVTLTDVVNDLRLPQAKHEIAMKIVKDHEPVRDVNLQRGTDETGLHQRMREVLDEEEYGNFAAAVARRQRTGPFVFTDRVIVN